MILSAHSTMATKIAVLPNLAATVARSCSLTPRAAATELRINVTA
jgi:hypothetical protein